MAERIFDLLDIVFRVDDDDDDNEDDDDYDDDKYNRLRLVEKNKKK